jgi:hypothetical protein
MPAFQVPRAQAFGRAKPRCSATGAKSVFLIFSATRLSHLILAALGLFCLVVPAFADAPRETQTLRVAVYDVPPYGYVDSDGSISGVSVDLWRRVAAQMEWPFRLIPISDMESIISGLEQGGSTRRSEPSRSRRKGPRASTSPIRLIGLGSPSRCGKKPA